METPNAWPCREDGKPDSSPARWSRGKLYYLLSNQLYVGRIRHRDQHFEGEHEAIVDAEQFAAVQALLASQSVQRKCGRTNSADIHLLTGLVYDETGDRLSPAHASNHGKRYRYYVSYRLKDSRDTSSGGWRIPARELEAVVQHQIGQILEDRVRLADWVQHFASAELIEGALKSARARKDRRLADQRDDLRSFVRRITVDTAHVTFQIDRKALVAILCGAGPGGQDAPAIQSEHPANGGSDACSITLPIAMKRRGIEARIVIADHVQARLPDQNLIDVIAKAHLYLGMLTDGTARTIAQVAAACSVHRADISRILPLAFLSPKIIEAIFAGRQPADLTARHLARLIDLSLAWQDQEASVCI